MIDFDLMLVHVGEFGLYQKILFLFQAPFCIFVTFVLFGQLFIYIYPRDFWCQENPCLFLNHSSLTREQRRNISIPYNFQNREFDPCNTYDTTAIQIIDIVNRAKELCSEHIECSNTSQICDYSVVMDRCSVRRFILISRKKRQTYSSGRHVGSQQYIEGTGNSDRSGQYSTYWRRTTTTGYPNYGGGGYTIQSGEIPSPRTTTTSLYTGRTSTKLPTTPKQILPPTIKPIIYGPAGPGSPQKNPNELDPICADIRINNYTVQRQINSTSWVLYNTSSTPSTPSNRNVVVVSPKLNEPVQINRIFVFLPNNTYIDVENLTNTWTTVPCRNWTYQQSDFSYETIVTELNWWCNAETRITIANAVFYLGAIVGGIGIGYIADIRGRVPALVTANLLGCLGGALSAIFYTNFYLFCFFRFICGMAFDNSFTMIYILVLEYVGPTYRTLVANLSIAVFYTIGTLILPWLALWIRNWRIYLLVISLPMSLAVLGIFVVPESARWLLSKGRTKEATRILRSFAKVNGRNVPEKIFVEFEADANKLYDEISQEKEPSLLEAFKKPRIAKNFILLTLIWSMIALVYDGHSRNVLNLGDNIFISFTIASSTEFPADMLLIFTLDRFGRRWLAFGSLCMSGGFSLAAALVPPGMAAMSLVMALLARFWVNVAFNIGLQYAAELLPTVIRAQGVNVIHIMGYVASIIAPFIASIGRRNPALSLIILGAIAISGGVLSLFLPESLGEDLPNTLEDGEVFGKDQSFWNCPICSKPRPPAEEPLELTPVQLRNNMRASLRGEGFRSSIISSKRTTPIDTMMMNPMATETTRLRRVATK